MKQKSQLLKIETIAQSWKDTYDQRVQDWEEAKEQMHRYNTKHQTEQSKEEFSRCRLALEKASVNLKSSKDELPDLLDQMIEMIKDNSKLDEDHSATIQILEGARSLFQTCYYGGDRELFGPAMMDMFADVIQKFNGNWHEGEILESIDTLDLTPAVVSNLFMNNGIVTIGRLLWRLRDEVCGKDELLKLGGNAYHRIHKALNQKRYGIYLHEDIFLFPGVMTCITGNVFALYPAHGQAIDFYVRITDEAQQLAIAIPITAKRLGHEVFAKLHTSASG